MMYNSKLAVALKSAGKVLRESNETVKLPFGSEYSVLIKNLNSVRALVKIEIDGEDVGDGTRFVIDPNDNVELERFIKNGNLKKGNRFKFIERTRNIEKHRGIGVEDGLVRVEFNFERQLQVFPQHTVRSYGGANIEEYTCSISNDSAPLNDAGITVPGSVSNQQFNNANSFPVENETHVLILKLLGQTEDNQRVVKAVAVKTKTKCITCGHRDKVTSKFCSECGTSLTIV